MLRKVGGDGGSSTAPSIVMLGASWPSPRAAVAVRIGVVPRCTAGRLVGGKGCGLVVVITGKQSGGFILPILSVVGEDFL
jgi:hypothetical protein